MGLGRTRAVSPRQLPTAEWVRRFFAYLSDRQQAPHPRVDAASVRDYLTCLAVRQQVSASTQNQALCALLFLCREVLGLDVNDLSATARAKRGPRLPTVLSVPETGALLGAMRGTPWLMAALIYGGGLYLGHTNVETTMLHTHVVKELRTPPRSPLDVLRAGGH